MRDFRAVAKTAARLAHAKHAEAVVALDVRRQTTLAEYFVLATVQSPAQMRAIQETLVHHFRSQGLALLRKDGEPTSRWMVLDYGGMVMHLMHPQVRSFYRMDQLWDGVRHVPWQMERERSLHSKRLPPHSFRAPPPTLSPRRGERIKVRGATEKRSKVDRSA